MAKRDRTIAYWHPKIGGGRVTIAITRYARRYGVSWCSPRDQFSRKVGRRRALADLNRYKSEIELPGDTPLREKLDQALAEAIDERGPSWAKRAALDVTNANATGWSNMVSAMRAAGHEMRRTFGDPRWAAGRDRGFLIWKAHREHSLRRQAESACARGEQECERLRMKLQRLEEDACHGAARVRADMEFAKECADMARLAVENVAQMIRETPASLMGCIGCAFAPEKSQYDPWPAACRHPLSGNLAIDHKATENPSECPLRSLRELVATAKGQYSPPTTSMIPIAWMQAMDDKLKANVHKGGDRECWRNKDVSFFLDKLGEKVAELLKAVRWHEPRRLVLDEAADVANVALMLADSYDWQMPPDVQLKNKTVQLGWAELMDLSDRVNACSDCPLAVAPSDDEPKSLCRYKFQAGALEVDNTATKRPQFCPLGQHSQPTVIKRYVKGI